MYRLEFDYQTKHDLALNQCKLYMPDLGCGLVFGSESVELTVLSAILGRILPSVELPDMDSFKYLYRDYDGHLQFYQNHYPEDVAYIGMDPDRHLHFSEVWEEFYVQTHLKKKDEILSVMKDFGLSERFFERKISSLSGGEKMRVAIAVAFTQNLPVTVLYGVVPWLDQNGRNILKSWMNHYKDSGRTVLMIEQEYSEYLDFIDHYWFFYGQSLLLSSRATAESHVQNRNCRDTIKKVNHLFSSKKGKLVLECLDLCFDDYPDSFEKRKVPLINDLDFTLSEQEIKVILGDNGSGKSTFLRLLFRMFKPNKGTILLENENIQNIDRKIINEKICFIDQFPENQMIYHTLGECRQQIKDVEIQELFDKIFGYPEKYPVTQLSFHELKILLLLVKANSKTRIILLDEPTWSMDQTLISRFFEVLYLLAEKYCFGVLIITHSLDLMPGLNSVNYLLCNGKLEIVS